MFNLHYKRGTSAPAEIRTLGGVDVSTLHAAGCSACPLNYVLSNYHPHMVPRGPSNAEVYVLAEAPGQREDERGAPLVGPSGQCLDLRVPDEWRSRVRYNNVVRTRPPDNREPSDVEIECCRPSVVGDIEAACPRVIIGLGNVSLYWATGQVGIAKWRGRRLPVRVGRHACWYFPVVHPSAILRSRKFAPRNASEYGSDDELAFAHDIRRAFSSLPTLPEPVIHTREFAESDVSWVTGHGDGDLSRVSSFLERAAAAPVAGVDLETNAKRPYPEDSRILTAAVSVRGEALAFAVDHREAGWSPADRNAVVELFYKFLTRARGRKAVHNLAFELEWAAVHLGRDITRAGRWDCTMSQAYILDERNRMGHRPDPLSLEFLGIQYFGINVKSLSRLNRDALDSEPLTDVLRYNGIDAKYHRLLLSAQQRRLDDEGLAAVYEEHLRRVPTMVLTQVQGVPIDLSVTRELDATYHAEMAEQARLVQDTDLARQFQGRFGVPFSPTSNQDVRRLLGLAGVDSVAADEAAVAQLGDNPAREPLTRFKKLAKAHSTYVAPQLRRMWPDGRLHSTISTTNTRTWRTAAEDPNTQNWPKRSGEKRVRRQVVALPGYEIVSFDWGQIQARNVAMESLDPVLVRALWDDYDIHLEWMQRIVQLHPAWVEGGPRALADPAVTKKYRDRAKNELVFPFLFGAEGETVAGYLGVPKRVGIQLSEEFWDKFRGVRRWQESKYEQVRELGYVSGLTEFRRRAPIAKNEIINAPIQADESAIVCDAMDRLSRVDLQAFLEVHDDLTFMWPRRRHDEYVSRALAIMLSPTYEWARVVPTVVEMSVGSDWYSMRDAGKFRSNTWGQ